MIYIPIDDCLKETTDLDYCRYGKSILLDVHKPQHFSPCSTDSRFNSAGINVICWSAFQLEVTSIE